jgi:hypothetical protein
VFVHCRDLAFILTTLSSPDIISPKGLLQSSRMRNMRVLFDGPLPTALDESVAPQPSARPPQNPRPASHGAHATRRRTTQEDITLNDEPSEGMWREEPVQMPRRGIRRQGRYVGKDAKTSHDEGRCPAPAMLVIPEHVESVAPAGALHRLPGARPGMQRSPTGLVGRNFAGVQTLTNLFETTRLSQVAPFKVSKVKSLVREYEEVNPYKRSTHRN